ncbi:hypothetical protein [Pseudidiomarina sp. CB1]|uniref:hypothetical protein n=1 Tax=Pseudidiomarina sp. CB1 TaxID=2972484 RepID=UPI0021611C04|nr:hypothetical protein [Pseudidiomarina sp. CB1]
MKHYANLYVDELKPSSEWLTLNRFAAYTGALVVVFVVTFIVLFLLARYQHANYVESYARASELSTELQTKQAQLEAAMKNSTLSAEINDVQQQLTLRQRLLAQMQNITGRNQVSFSQLLQDLAAADDQVIWLQRIMLTNDALTLQGRTLQPQTLPTWLAEFSSYPALKERPFGVFEIRDEGELGLQFTVGHLDHARNVSASAGRSQP